MINKEELKQCTYCLEEKPKSEFQIRRASKDGLTPWCKSCYSEITKKRYKDNSEHYKGKVSEWGKNNPEKIRNGNLKRHYNLTLDNYNELFIKQEGCCAICGTHQSEMEQCLCVDHNHTTNIIRGLLCKNCNLGIGFFKENVEILKMAIDYLSKYK